jgi:hypothetical protein
MEMRMEVNESRDESEEEEVSTFEDMNYILDTFEYDHDMAGDLEGMDSDSGRYSDDLRMLVLEGDDGDAGRVHEWKCGEMMGYVGSGSFDIDKSGH